MLGLVKGVKQLRIRRTGALGRSPFSLEVLNDLRKRIILGDIAAGSMISERNLSEEFGVSRGPVRNAILRLESEGLLETRPNGRVMVVGITSKDINDLYAVRFQLEGFALRLLCNRRGVGPIVGDLNEIIEQLERDINHQESGGYTDMRFHKFFISETGNRALLKAWSVHEDFISSLIDITNVYELRSGVIIKGHREIVDCIARQDEEGAIRSLRDHLALPRRFLCERFSELVNEQEE